MTMSHESKDLMQKHHAHRSYPLWESIKRHPLLYLMVIPGVTFFIMFRVVPSFGSIIAWQKYSIFKGVWHSPWVGWQNFQQMFAYADFGRIMYNTLAIGGMLILFGFPVPIALAILINEIRSQGFKRLIQTVIYMPHFLSWVIVGQLVYSLLSPTSGHRQRHHPGARRQKHLFYGAGGLV
jgi:putative aldouronate transport system permease protein